MTLDQLVRKNLINTLGSFVFEAIASGARAELAEKRVAELEAEMKAKTEPVPGDA